MMKENTYRQKGISKEEEEEDDDDDGGGGGGRRQGKKVKLETIGSIQTRRRRR